MMRAHLTAEADAKAGDIVRTECGRKVARRTPEQLEGMTVCATCERAAEKDRYRFTYRLQVYPVPSGETP